MDYVKGLPIHVSCDQQKLSVEERLKLFRLVCATVAYAHQQQVHSPVSEAEQHFGDR